MAATTAEFNISPYFGGSAVASGAVTPFTVIPTNVFLSITFVGQVAPPGPYSLAQITKGLYAAVVNDALVGIYYWYCEDENNSIIASGYIDLLDDTSNYRASKDHNLDFTYDRVQHVQSTDQRVAKGEAVRRSMNTNGGAWVDENNHNLSVRKVP